MGFLFFPIMLSAFGFATTFAVLAVVPFLILVVTLTIRWEPIGFDVEAEGHEMLTTVVARPTPDRVPRMAMS